MANFLALVNQLRMKMREEGNTTGFDTGQNTLVQKSLIQQSSREVLEDNEWSFMIRDDGQAFLPAEYTSAATATVTRYSTSGSFNDAEIVDTNKWVSPRRTRLVVTEDTRFPDQTYTILEITDATGQMFTLTNPYYGDSFSSSGSATIYCNEIALPTDVLLVLSVLNENEPLALVQVDKHITFDSVIPRPHGSTSGNPSTVYVGSSVVGTAFNVTQGSDTVTARTSIGMMVYPVPDSDILLRYSYQKKADALSGETDILAGVPDTVEDHIVDVAFEKALYDNVEDDSRRAIRLRDRNAARLEKLLELDEPARNRRKVLTPFGGHVQAHPNTRWDSREVPSP